MNRAALAGAGAVTRGSTLSALALCAAVAYMALSPLGHGAGQDPQTAGARGTDSLPRPTPIELRIEERLTQPVSIEFVETPLSDVVEFLHELTGINVVLDRTELAEAGITPDTPVTVNVQEIPFRSALRLLLNSISAGFLVADDVLELTTEADAARTLFTRVYPVRDLAPDPEGLEELEVAVRKTIDPNSWEDVGGSGSVVQLNAAASLVILQSYGTHRRIQELLRNLREARAVPPVGKDR